MNHLKEILTPEFVKRCEQLELEPNVVATHFTRVKNALEGGADLSIPIIDTCRLDNAGIIASDHENIKKQKIKGIASFIPAAGASSRYYQPFAGLLQALESDSVAEVERQIAKLKETGADKWPLPQAIKTLFEGNAPDVKAAEAALKLPKGLLPCVAEGDSFFDMKLTEDLALPFIDGTMYVVAPDHRKKFEAALSPKHSDRVAFAEQGPKLSTIRITEDCKPYIEENGGFSRVPAGHGMLASLLPGVKHSFPDTHSVLIRNIDNVIGTNENVIAAATKAAQAHCFIQSHIQSIRTALSNGNRQQAEQAATTCLTTFGITSASGDPLWGLQKGLFHCDQEIAEALYSEQESDALLRELYDRPVNTLGMVPNTNHDVGGTPVFGRHDNTAFKLCLEVPHSSEKDRENFLANPEKATHFNPVFAFAEVNFAADYYQQSPLSCWLLAKKTYQGKTVYYHETVLYELLGNNLLGNATFLEIPRSLFNPHKQPKDASSRSLSNWVRNA